MFSGDDYYTLSSGLVVCETTIGMHGAGCCMCVLWGVYNSSDNCPWSLCPGTYNTSSYDLITYNTVFEAARNTVANRLASSGQEWSSLFGMYNNGCYNNQVRMAGLLGMGAVCVLGL